MSVFCNGTCASEGSVKNRVESEFKWCKVHLSLRFDRFFPLMVLCHAAFHTTTQPEIPLRVNMKRPIHRYLKTTRVIKHKFVSFPEYCGCLNGGWCQEGGVCDCVQFQALGERCQIIYLKMSEEHLGGPCGLCGNFNHLAGDDLTTARIRTDEPSVFANSWAVDLPHERACPSVDLDFNGPCHSKFDMDDAIEKCSALLFFPFLSCHENIDPNPFVASCVSDLCVSDDEETFCQALVEYTRACSHVGYPVREWRDSFPSCNDGCEESFVYRDCISCCPPTCTFGKECLGTNLHCLDGCYCPDGLILQNGTCIAVSQCPCVYHGTSYVQGHVLQQGCSVCVCMGGVWNCTENNCTAECSVVGDVFVTTFDGRMFLQPGSCQYVLVKSRSSSRFTVTLQYTTCAEVASMITSIHTLTHHAVDITIRLCIYSNALEVQRLTSVFMQLKAAVGLRLHYDGRGGRVYLQLGSQCPSYSVEVGECPEDKVYHSCGEQRGGVACSPTCRNLMLNLTCPPSTPCVPGCVCPPGLVLHHSKCYYPENCPCAWLGLEYLPGKTVETPCYKCVCHRGYFNCSYSPCPAVCTVYSNRHYHTFDGLEYDYYSDCQVYLLKVSRVIFSEHTAHCLFFLIPGLLSGLCGNFDSVTVNDMTTSSQMEVNNAQTFGDSWALGQCESDYVVERPCEGDLGRQPYAKRECALLYSDVFAPCHNVVDVAWFYRNCLTDTCNCNRGGDCECLCTSIAAYAHKCCQQGVTIHWRSPSVYPYDCEYFNQELGEGPFSLVSAAHDDTVFGVNRSSGSVFPLVRERPGQLPAPGLLFNFMITAGLQKERTSCFPVVSLESAERPNYFLVVSGRSLQLERWSRGPEFSLRGTFIQHQGLFLPGHTSFELVGQPGVFLTLTRTAAQAEPYDSSEGFKASSCFTLEESNFVIPYRMMCEWRYQACASPCVHSCGDPDATRCQFLPPVEGCFPRCPKNMFLDEVTRRCVYAEDCEYSGWMFCHGAFMASDATHLVFVFLKSIPRVSFNINCFHQLICFNGELLLHNSSLHCRYSTTQPQCSLLGLPILISRCTMMSDMRVITFDGNNVALYDNGSFIREECVCAAVELFCTALTPLSAHTVCIYLVAMSPVCTDNEGNPRAPGEVWNGSFRGCCLYKCMENSSVVAVEPDFSSSLVPLCEREGEYVLDVLKEGSCCPKKICGDEAPPCDNGNRLVIGYSALSCCPKYRCECDAMACPPVSVPNCREDQFLVEVRGAKSCCYSYLCVCESCIESIPSCSHGEILAVDLNTTNSCCPQYYCMCDVNLCPDSSVTCAPGLSLVQTTVPGHCCLQHHCECQCEDSSSPICQVVSRFISQLWYGMIIHALFLCACIVKAEVCLFQGVTVLGPGQSLVQYFEGDMCYAVHCLHHKDPDSGFFAMEIISVNCSQKCGPHQVYVTSTNPQVCCGACKNVSCTFNNENGTAYGELHTLRLHGNSSGAVILASGVICPPFNETECIQVRTSMCKEDGKTCKRVAIRTTIRKDDCRSNAPVTVYSCDGKCPSATIFNFNINSHARFCKCCRESELQTRSVTLFCSRNATVVEYNFQEPLDCSCQ
uniref:Otogelin-like n=1 Tax=Gasterosteus aculeatus aculeatus TaxID=481459 RepID=A0AAQ4RHR6_GASAC